MSIWKISLQNIKSKPLYTFLSVFILALSSILLLGIQQLKSSFEYQMAHNLGEIDMVIGAKGSPLQLVLASVLHLDNPTGNISYHEALKIGKNPLVKSAIPISYGDNYKGFRIVGTTNQFMTLYTSEFANGRGVEKSLEVVLGAAVAEQLSLEIGDTFLSSHGLLENSIDVHSDKLTVVGILQPTQKVIDRLILTNLQSVWDVHNHEEEEHDDHEEVEQHESHENGQHGDHKEKGHHKEAEQHENHEHEEHDDHAEEGHRKEAEQHENHEHEEHDNHTEEGHRKEAEQHENHEHEEHDDHVDEDHHKEVEQHENHEHEEHEEHDDHAEEGHHEDVEQHDSHEHEQHDDHKEITSLLVSFRNPRGLLTMPRKINKRTNMQAALPKYELDRLYEYTGVGFKTISGIAYLILIISGIIIFTSLYKMVKERTFDLAIMRTYGASNVQLIKIVAYEGFIIGFGAFIVGFICVKVGINFLFKIMNADDKLFMLQELSFQEILPIGILVFILTSVSILLAIYPILKMDISTILSNEK